MSKIDDENPSNVIKLEGFLNAVYASYSYVLKGFESQTYALGRRCSIQLSYWDKMCLKRREYSAYRNTCLFKFKLSLLFELEYLSNHLTSLFIY